MVRSCVFGTTPLYVPKQNTAASWLVSGPVSAERSAKSG